MLILGRRSVWLISWLGFLACEPETTHEPAAPSVIPTKAEAPRVRPVMEHGGETYRLKRDYRNYDSFKDDREDAVAPADRKRAADAVAKRPVASSYPSYKAMNSAMFELKFPGFGLTGWGQKRLPDGSTLNVTSIEIPYRDAERVLVHQSQGANVILIDDLIIKSNRKLDEITVKGDVIHYKTDGVVKTRRKLVHE